MAISICFSKVRQVSNVISNSDMPYNFPRNDWSILKLSAPLELNADVFPACLPSSSDYLSTSSTEDRCFTSGWGTLSPGTTNFINNYSLIA